MATKALAAFFASPRIANVADAPEPQLDNREDMLDLPAQPRHGLSPGGLLATLTHSALRARYQAPCATAASSKARAPGPCTRDGGEEHGACQLESTLAVADLVLCQAGCVSHNACWRARNDGKRSGQRCVFANISSATSLQRALTDIRSGA